MDNLTDQQHIDALSEPVKDALRWLHGGGSAFGNTTQLMIDRIPKPSPKRDPVEKLAARIRCEWRKYEQDGPYETYALHYLIERGLLNMESVK